MAAFVQGADPADRALSFFENRVKSDPDDFIAWNRLGERCLMLLRQTGDDAWIARAEQAAQGSLQAIPDESNPEGLALRARVDLASHRFSEARAAARRLCAMEPGKSRPLPILADALIELGALEEAGSVIDGLEKIGGDALTLASRRARLAFARGRLDEARECLGAACDAARALKPPSTLTVAWCEVQLGELAFRTGDWDIAEKHYSAALAAMPNWWSALDHLAELRGAQGRHAEALSIYEAVTAQTPRAEVLQAAGDLLLFCGRGDEAKPWHDRAREAYLRATGQGSAGYFHHLAGFYTDSQPNPGAAVEMASKDLELRQCAQAYDAFAWALYKSGKIEQAAGEITKALAGGFRDAHVFYHAAMIRISAGDIAAGKAALRDAVAVNPRLNTFHAHR